MILFDALFLFNIFPSFSIIFSEINKRKKPSGYRNAQIELRRN